MDYLHQRNIAVSINFHPDSGIDHCQAPYTDMAGAIGFDVSQNATIPDLNPQAENKTYVDAFFSIVRLRGGRSSERPAPVSGRRLSRRLTVPDMCPRPRSSTRPRSTTPGQTALR